MFSTSALLIHFPMEPEELNGYFFCTVQAKLILEKITTLFFDIYFTFLFIHTFVSHFPYVTFFLKAAVIFFVFRSRRRAQSEDLIELVYLKKILFFSLIGLAIYPRPYLQLSAFTCILTR